MEIHVTTTPARRRPRTGDTRTTKKHGLQIHIPDRVQSGPFRGTFIVGAGGRQRFLWVSPAEARTRGYGIYVPQDECETRAPAYPLGYMQQRGAA